MSKLIGDEKQFMYALNPGWTLEAPKMPNLRR